MVDWKCKRKGTAHIYTHPDIPRAIVENHYGVSFNGAWFDSVEDAKNAAVLAAQGGE